MILNLYSIKDKLMDFQGVLTIASDEIAERIFEGYCRREQKTNFTSPKYFELYKVGSFDSETGVITSLPKQEIKLLKEGEQYEQND